MSESLSFTVGYEWLFGCVCVCVLCGGEQLGPSVPTFLLQQQSNAYKDSLHKYQRFRFLSQVSLLKRNQA